MKNFFNMLFVPSKQEGDDDNKKNAAIREAMVGHTKEDIAKIIKEAEGSFDGFQKDANEEFNKNTAN